MTTKCRRIVHQLRLKASRVVVYVATALLATALFFFLHHLGNQISYETAVQRFAEEFETVSRNEGYTRKLIPPFEYCQMAGMVLVGSKNPDEYTLYQSLLLMKTTLRYTGPHDAEDYCEELAAAVNGHELGSSYSNHYYWWGNKAIFALALPYLSVTELRNLVQFGSYAGWVVLAAILLLLAPRTLFIMSPLIVLGAFASGVRYFSDFVSGLPYIFSVWTAVVLALLLRGKIHSRITPAVRRQLVHFFCFIIGLVSAYLWAFDGHTMLLITLIGLLTYFTSARRDSAGRRKLAAWCIGLYVAGFLASYGLGLAVKIALSNCLIPDWYGWQQFCGGDLPQATVKSDFAGRASGYVKRTIWEILFSLRESLEGIPILEQFVRVLPSLDDDPWYRRINRISLLTDYWIFAGIRSELWSVILTCAWLLLLLPSTAFAVIRYRQGQTVLRRNINWIWALIALFTLQLLVCNDLHYRISRYMFVLYGLSLSCMLLALTESRLIAWSLQAAKASRWSNFLRQSNFRYAAWAGLVIFATLLYSSQGESSFMGVQEIAETGLGKSKPIVSGPFDLYLDDNTLVYVKEPCVYQDLVNPFFLHVIPADPSKLPNAHQQYNFDNLDFGFGSHPFYYKMINSSAPIFFVDGRCVVVRHLPDYPIARIRTGQHTPEGRVWEAVFSPDDIEFRSLYPQFLTGEPLIRADFDIYSDQGRLVYVKEQCADTDTAARFFLHVYPVDRADLPSNRRQYGMANLDFNFDIYGFRHDGRCIAVRHLPDYPIARIRTGQHTPEGRVWEAVFSPDDIEFRSLYPQFLTGEPLIRADFDIYSDQGRLVYVKEQCADTDTAARFFLHVYPVDRADLPSNRRQYGMANLDFNFDIYGFRHDGRCIAVRHLPDYPIARIRTGQYIPEGRVWEAVFSPDDIEFRSLYPQFLTGEPLIRADFDIYSDQGRLVYVKEQCADTDTAARFFLHVYPVDRADLPSNRRQYGMANLDFNFDIYGFRHDGRCIAVRHLPDYPIARIRTGQYIVDGKLEPWSAKFDLHAVK